MSGAPRATPTYRYWLCDLRSGVKLGEVLLKPNGPLPERISDVSTVVFECDLAAQPAGSDTLGFSTPGKSVVVCEREYKGDSVTDIPWAGIIANRDFGNGPVGTFNAATPGAYLARRQVGSHTYVSGPGDTDTQIITDLMADAAPEGINFTLDIDCPTVRTWRVLSSARTHVLACLADLSAIDGGPEWTIVTRWADPSRLAIQFTLIARTRLGWAGEPNATFDFPGAIREYTTHDDFTSGHGANSVVGANTTGAASDPVRDEQALTQGWPRWEEVVQSSGDLSMPGLIALAKGALAKRARGQSTTDLSVDLTQGPQTGRDVSLGDNITFAVHAQDADGNPSPSWRHPQGHRETIRMIGYGLDILGDTLTPVLWSPYEDAN